jgi:hypothetical protein
MKPCVKCVPLELPPQRYVRRPCTYLLRSAAFSGQILRLMVYNFVLIVENNANLVRLVAPIEFIKSTLQGIDKTGCHRIEGC